MLETPIDARQADQLALVEQLAGDGAADLATSQQGSSADGHPLLDALAPLLERHQPNTRDPVTASEVLDAITRGLETQATRNHEAATSVLGPQAELSGTASTFASLATNSLAVAGQGGHPPTGERLITASQVLSLQASLAAHLESTNLQTDAASIDTDGAGRGGPTTGNSGFASDACLNLPARPVPSTSPITNPAVACDPGLGLDLDPEVSAFELARYAARLQAQRAGTPVPTSVDTPNHSLPSQAIDALVKGQQTSPAALPQPGTEALDELEPTMRGPLTDLLNALVGYDAAASEAYQDGDLPAPGQRASLFAARDRVLEATEAFQTALDAHPEIAMSGPVYDDHPTLRIDLSGTSRDYTRNYSYIIDVGGSDAYMNNAGGNTFGDCNQTVDAAALIDVNTPGQPNQPAPPEIDYFNTDRTGLWTTNACGKNGGAWGAGSGLLVSTEGDDVFGDRYDPLNDIHRKDHKQGVNGGVDGIGTGLLLDTAGNESYELGGVGTNGGAHGTGAFGLLVDHDGQDVYRTRGVGTNGGADAASAHAGLIDAAGADTYEALFRGTNGGAHGMGASAMLIDLGGQDTYDASNKATNGGASQGGLAALVDIDNPALPGETYQARDTGTNGGATGTNSVGLLADLGAAQRFDALDQGTNGGAHAGGTGMLLTVGSATLEARGPGANGGADGAGTGELTSGLAVVLGQSDRVQAYFGPGVNGGANGPNANGALITGGTETYQTNEKGSNGGGADGGSGLLVDLGPVGVDVSGGSLVIDPLGTSASYEAFWTAEGVNGGASGPHSQGTLVDLGVGSDTYDAGSQGTNGGATGSHATALLLDAGGSETYNAGHTGTNGGGAGGGAGVLVDLQDADLLETDTYQAGSQGTNGGATGTGSTGLLADLGFSDDTVTAGDTGTNGGGANGGAGLLFNDNGEDTYTAGDDGTNGGAVNGGIGMLVDQAADDTYIAGINGVNGGANSATALLLDIGGLDTFDESNNAYDCSEPGDCNEIPKGNTGARITT